MVLSVDSYSASVVTEIPHKRAEKNNKSQCSALWERCELKARLNPAVIWYWGAAEEGTTASGFGCGN